MTPLLSDPVLVAIAAGSGGVLTALVALANAWLRRDVDSATADASRSTAKKDDLEVLRGVIAELREERTEATGRIDALEARMALLEERERHALTRAAVHEAWDQLAFATLLAHNPAHPPPPPLTLARRERDDRDAQDARDDRDARNVRADRDARNAREDRDDQEDEA